jgi:predicted Co/Zn/Cd cation transporter (cation efflux family)
VVGALAIICTLLLITSMVTIKVISDRPSQECYVNSDTKWALMSIDLMEAMCIAFVGCQFVRETESVKTKLVETN